MGKHTRFHLQEKGVPYVQCNRGFARFFYRQRRTQSKTNFQEESSRNYFFLVRNDPSLDKHSRRTCCCRRCCRGAHGRLCQAMAGYGSATEALRPTRPRQIRGYSKKRTKFALNVRSHHPHLLKKQDPPARAPSD